jgi:hypothetical protein
MYYTAAVAAAGLAWNRIFSIFYFASLFAALNQSTPAAFAFFVGWHGPLICSVLCLRIPAIDEAVACRRQQQSV